MPVVRGGILNDIDPFFLETLSGWLGEGGLDIPAPFLSEFVEGGVPVDGIGIGEAILEIAEGAGAGDDERGDGPDFFHGEIAVDEVISETVKENAEEDGFLGEGDVSAGFEEGIAFFRRDAALVIAVGDGVAVARGSADEAGVWGAAGWIGMMDGPGFARFAFGGDGGAFGYGGGHCDVSF